jgi:isoquinoline 1-oxidoreductase subunit beta
MDAHAASLSRRQVMIGAAGLSFAVALAPTGAVCAASLAERAAGKPLNPWVSIATDGTITIMAPAVEMGQGSLTALPRILAEELDADWDEVVVTPPPPDETIYGNPAYGMMYTAGSNAVRSYFMPLRMFGAQVRRVLIENAARKWNVPASTLITEPSVVLHRASGRRLSYGEIAAFAEIPAKAPQIKAAELKKPSEFRLIGKNILRVEMPGKVDGSADYAINVQIPGMLYGTILRAPIEGAAPDRIEETGAKAVPGVIRIVRLAYGVGVLAETAWAAFDGHRALQGAVTWTHDGKAWSFDSEKAANEYARAARDPDAPAHEWYSRGDATAAMKNAAKRIAADYLNDYAYHAQIEPLNAAAAVAPTGDSAEVWCGTQSQTMAQEAVAKALGIPRSAVTLHYTLLGGGFGRRGHRDEEFVVDAVLMSKAARRPVKVMWTREDDVHNARMRPLSAHHLQAGLAQDGKIVALHQRIAVDRVLPFADPVRYEQRMMRDGIVMRGVELESYDIAHLTAEHLFRDSGLRTSPLRGIGWTANIFAAEGFLDEVAQARGMDPVAMRLELLKNLPRGRKVVETVAAMADWGKPREGRGMGFAFLDYSDTLIAAVAAISVDRTSGTIKVHDVWCALDCGIEVHPDNILAQTESSIVYGLGMSLFERITVKNGAVQQSNFYDYRIPRLSDVPDIHLKLVATANRPTGVGQMGTPLMAPAIASAFHQLTGRRLRHSPMIPARVIQALA